MIFAAYGASSSSDGSQVSVSRQDSNPQPVDVNTQVEPTRLSAL